MLPKSSRHTFEGDAASSEASSLALMNILHLRCGACKGSIYPPTSPESPSGGRWRAGRTRNDGRHKCRPYKDLKRKFLYYQVTKPEVTLLSKLELGNSLIRFDYDVALSNRAPLH